MPPYANILRYALASAVTLCALAVPATAHAANIVNLGGGAITINDKDMAHPTGIASPYPGTLDITGGDGPITGGIAVRVALTHDNIDDLDLALVAPNGAASVLMSDACGTGSLSQRTFDFFSVAAGPLSDAGPCPAGQYLPSDYVPGDTWPAPGPGTGLTANLNNFDGGSANGDWKLYAVDDSAFQAGAISNWGLQIETSTALIVVPGLGATSGTASPYSSVKNFPTGSGQVIDDVNLTVTGFNHEHPADVDMLLQGPTGETVMVMSDACGGDDIANNRDYTFDDAATLPLSDGNSTNCSSGSRRPSDFGDPPENMPLPLPPRPYGASMSVFNGLPGGTFRLWVNDDAGSDIGYIAGWNLTMTTRPPAATGFAATAVPTAEGQTATLTVSRTGSANVGVATVNVAVVDGETDSRDFGHALPTKLDFARGEASKTIEIPINADVEREGPETFQVALADATGDAVLADATSIAKVTIAGSAPDNGAPDNGAPDNRFTVGRAVRLRNGSAEIAVTIPGPGKLTSDDVDGTKDRLKTTDAFPNAAGTTILKVKPERRTKRKLRRGKKVSLTAEITYTPDGGSANTAEAPVVLKKKPE